MTRREAFTYPNGLRVELTYMDALRTSARLVRVNTPEHRVVKLTPERWALDLTIRQALRLLNAVPKIDTALYAEDDEIAAVVRSCLGLLADGSAGCAST